MTKYKFRIGQHVQKVTGYSWPGVVIMRGRTTSGKIRYVVECIVPAVRGALHIYNGEQLVAGYAGTTKKMASKKSRNSQGA